MLTGAQIRMARGVMGWSVADLAKASGVSGTTIKRMEDAEGVPNALAENLSKLQRVFEAAGLELIPENGGGVGIRFRNRRDGTRGEH